MNDDLNYDLIAKYLSGECSESEARKLESRIRKDPEQELIFSELKKIWDAKSATPNLWDVEKKWEQLIKEINKADDLKSKKSIKKNSEPILKALWLRNKWLIRFAAVFLIVGCTVFLSITYFYDFNEAEELTMQEVTTEKGQRAEIRLKDGSAVQLNADSRLSYSREFGSENRTVHLKGEAYFDVVTAERPFIVYTENTVTKILGTRFNIQAYTDDDEVRVVVAEGKVNVRYSDEAEEESAILEKGDMANLKPNGVRSVIHGVDLQNHLGWLESRLLFENEPMTEVVKKLERWYGVDISFSDSGLAQLRLSANFEENTLYEVLRVIQLALDLEYQIKGTDVMFSPASDREAG